MQIFWEVQEVYIGVDTPIEKVLSFVQGELQKEIAMDRIPDALKNRFEWLFGQDVQAQETLLRNFCHSEIELILEKLKLEIPVLQNQVKTKQALDVKISFRDKSVYRSHGKCDTLTNSKTMLFHAF